MILTTTLLLTLLIFHVEIVKISAIKVLDNSTVVISVNVLNDLPFHQTNCSDFRTIRAAWNYCHSLYNVSECHVSLPIGEMLYFNKSLGSLHFSSAQFPTSLKTIKIDGNGATVIGIEGEKFSKNEMITTNILRPRITNSDSPIKFSVCPGMTAIISTCHPESTGNTVMRLFDGTTKSLIKENDDGCGLRSRLDISTDSSESGCVNYEATVFCRHESECGARITIEIIPTKIFEDDFDIARMSNSTQFISGIVKVTGPQLLIENITLDSFGDIYTNGGAIGILLEHNHQLSAVSHQQASLDIHNVVFRNNVAANGGALAIMVEGEESGLTTTYNNITVSVSNAQFHNNSAKFHGGGMFIKSYSVVPPLNDIVINITNLTISSCMADIGGGIAIDSIHSTILTGIILSDSYSITTGGAIDITSSSNITISYVNISECSTEGYGGGISIQNSEIITIQNILMNSLSALSGGGAFFINTTSQIHSHHVNLHEVTAVYGGGLFIHNSVFVDFSNHTITSGEALTMGSGYQISDTSALTMNHIVIRHSNTISGQGGGAIVIFTTTNASLHDITVTDSTAGYGCGIVIYHSSSTTISDVIVRDCSSVEYAGGVNIGNSNDIVLSNLTVYNTSSSHCGGILIDYSNSLTFLNVLVEQTAATNTNGVGGGICMYDTKKTTWKHVEITHSQSQSHGGGFYLSNCLEIDFIYVNVLNCITIDGDGGGYYLEQHNDHINFVSGNTESNRALVGSGGGYYISSLNTHLHWLDQPSYENNKTFIADKKSINETFLFPHASEVIFYFTFNSFMNPDINSCCTNLTIVNGHDGTVLFTFQEDYWPGIDQAPTILHNITNIHIIYDNPQQLSNNHIAILFIPVYHLTTKQALVSEDVCQTRNNFANDHGGGIMMSYSNLGFIMLHHKIELNHAQTGSGGGIYLRSSNLRSIMLYTGILSNFANFNGGGIYLGMSHSSIRFENIMVINNIAKLGQGGGQYLFSTNGNGGLKYGNQVNYTNCLFNGNIAGLSGGGMYMQEQNALIITNTMIEGNIVQVSSTTSNGHGGGIAMSDNNEISLQRVQLINNKALNGCGGAIVATSINNIVTMLIVEISSSQAYTGGGICLMASSSLFIQQRLVLHNNQAIDAGGAVVLMKSPLWNCNDPYNTCDVIVSSNRATRASVLFLVAVPTTLSVAIGNVTIMNNVATEGCTVEWTYDRIAMPNPPSVFALVSVKHTQVTGSISSGSVFNRIVFSGNYPNIRIGTQAMTLHLTKTINVKQFNQALSPYIIVKTVDYYNRTVGNATLIVDVLNDYSNCVDIKNPYVVTGSKSLHLIRGIANLTELKAFCYPHGNMTVQITVPINPLPSGLLSTSSDSSSSCSASSEVSNYALIGTSTLQFRPCYAGEYIEDGNCVMCPNSTYSLISLNHESIVTDSSLCKSCVGITGISQCYGNTIIVKPGYWRRYPESAAVIPCLSDEISCKGGSATGNDLCNEGYTGPLCAVCADGYHMSNSECLPCKYQGITLIQISALVFILLLLVILAVIVYRRYMKIELARQQQKEKCDCELQTTVQSSTLAEIIVWCKNAFTDIMVKMKIVIATYQVVISSAEVFDVTMPGSYGNFCRLFSFLNLNLSNIIPINCMFPRTNFIRRLQWATLAPFGLIICLIIGMLLEFVYHLLTENKQISTIQSSKEESFKKARTRYLNLIFYLTYLVLPSVTTMIFQLFICTNVDPNQEDNDHYDSYLVADVNISCNSSYYRQWFWYGIAMVIVYPIGIPAFYFYCLYQNREEIINRQLEDTNKHYVVNLQQGDHEHDEQCATLKQCDENDSESDVEPGYVIYSWFCQLFGYSTVNKSDIDDDRDSDDMLNNIVKEITKEFSEITKSLSRGVSRKRSSMVLRRTCTAWYFERKLSEETMNMSFLWEAYKPEYWYWELVETSRRMLLTSVLSICSPGTIKQTILGIFMAYSFNKLYYYVQPYYVLSDYRLAEIGQSQIFLTYFITLLLIGNIVKVEYIFLLGISLILINIIVGLMGFYYEFKDYLIESKLKLKEKMKEIVFYSFDDGDSKEDGNGEGDPSTDPNQGSADNGSDRGQVLSKRIHLPNLLPTFGNSGSSWLGSLTPHWSPNGSIFGGSGSEKSNPSGLELTPHNLPSMNFSRDPSLHLQDIFVDNNDIASNLNSVGNNTSIQFDGNMGIVSDAHDEDYDDDTGTHTVV